MKLIYTPIYPYNPNNRHLFNKAKAGKFYPGKISRVYAWKKFRYTITEIEK